MPYYLNRPFLKNTLMQSTPDKGQLNSFYEERIKQFNDQASILKKRYNQLALFRLLFFFLGIGLLIYLWSINLIIGGICSLVFIALFGFFISRHQEILNKHKNFLRLAEINEAEKQALSYDFSGFRTGERFLEAGHPYAIDLDLYGSFALFPFISRSSTELGEEALANFLSEPAGLEEIKNRQDAIVELAPKVEWRQQLQAYGTILENESANVSRIKNWLGEPVEFVNKSWLIPALLLVPVITVVGTVLIPVYLSWQWLLLLYLLPGLILRQTHERVSLIHEETAAATELLANYAQLIGHLEPSTFQSTWLKRQLIHFKHDRIKASKEINRLSFIIRQLNVRYNFFAIFLNLFGLWDLQYIRLLEKWKIKNRGEVEGWFRALGQIDGLNGFANLYYNYSDWTFPDIHTQELLAGESLGHPLIHPSERVCNDLSMPTFGHIKLVTGSNMAGKSTFLRTVGINVVLAMAGAPVCAKSLALPLIYIYTSMRTQDALHESTSSFFAELKRLKLIIEAVETEKDRQDGFRVFFLLDEILKGTNSRDRHTGAKALIRQLIKEKGAGIIATHDLELGVLEATSGGAIENLCMEVEVEKGELIFDYKLEKGVSKSFNATHLMRRMGIKIDEGLD